MNIFITGCGKTGAELAVRLTNYGHDIVVIDRSERNFDDLPDNFNGLTYCGVPIDEDVLVKAGINDCDALFAVSYDDNENLMVAQLAKTVYGVDKVIARVSDSEKEAFFSTFGITTVCPTNLTVDSLITAFGEFNGESCFSLRNHTVRMFSIPVPEDFLGERALDITLEENEILFAVINSEGEVKLVSNYNFVLNEGDTLVFAKTVD